jgi:hypothetical protein
VITPILDSGPVKYIVTTPILDSGPVGYGDNSYSRLWSCGLW